MIVGRIYINTHRYDLEFTRLCIASVRYWYPDLPVSLIVDNANGPFPNPLLLKKWNIDILDTGGRGYGWGFGKFEPLFLSGLERFLVLDADTVITGDILSEVSDRNEDFIVDDEDIDSQKLSLLYYDIKQVSHLFPGFVYPGYMFNTGQWFGTSGLVSKSDFNGLVRFTEYRRPELLHPELFKQADQGIFNFLIHRLSGEKKISVGRMPIMVWPENGKADFIRLNSIKERRSDFPFVIHWAGMKFQKREDFPRHDILDFYEGFLQGRASFIEKLYSQLLDRYLPFDKTIRRKYQKFLKSRSL